MIEEIVEGVHPLGVSKIALRNPKGIRENHKNGKVNSMMNNFWSFAYIIKRFSGKAEEYGMKVEFVSEYKTSTTVRDAA